VTEGITIAGPAISKSQWAARMSVTTPTRSGHCCPVRTDPRPCGRVGRCLRAPAHPVHPKTGPGRTDRLSAALPGDSEPVAAAVERAGWAFTAPELFTIVSSSSANELITPEFTVAPVSDQVPKFASGRILLPRRARWCAGSAQPGRRLVLSGAPALIIHAE